MLFSKLKAPMPVYGQCFRTLVAGHLRRYYFIRTLAVTPTKSKDASYEDVTKICYDYTISGLTNMTLVANKPFRFVYTSGVTVERDQTKILPFPHDYRLMNL
jgi:hypothetical protein